MPAGTYKLEIEQGADFVQPLRWIIPDGTSEGTPINISGYTIRMMARVTIDDAVPAISLSTISPPGGITITDGPNGKFQLAMNAQATAALKFNEALYDLEMVSPGGLVTRLLEGTITLKREVTR